MVKHRVGVIATIDSDWIWLWCSCGWNRLLGYSPTAWKVYQTALEHVHHIHRERLENERTATP